tara:strand:+ start:193 stop:432 length:240 start_codon:yes stop_codon:yes gene_type:complete
MSKQNEIEFISAFEGGIKMFSGEGVVGYGDTAEMIAYVLKTKGLSSSASHSSSMDFANEEGFKNHDDAWKLWNDAMELV